MARRAKAKPKSKGRKNTAGITDKAQSARFIEAARDLALDEDNSAFEKTVDALLKKRTKSGSPRSG